MTSDGRVAWLAAICARDAALGADLESLLAEHEDLQESRYLERAAAPGQRPDDMPSLAGQIVGAYRLLSLIGQGGMGSVWLAERCDGRFEGRVAVKLLNIALMGRAGEERFRREGNFLAKVTHPHIARLIDAGVSAAGQPYLVLEHVERSTHRPLLRRARARDRGAHPSLSRRARGRRPRAREPDRAPGHQAGQCAGQRGWPGQAARLRHRQAAQGRRAVGRFAERSRRARSRERPAHR